MKDVNKKTLGYMVVLSSWLAIFCLFGYRATFSLLLGPMSKDLGWSVSKLSLGYSLMMSVYALTAFFSGMIIDKWGTKPAYAIGSICAALGFYLTSNAHTYIFYLLPYVLFAGVGTGMLWVSSTISVRKWFCGKTYGTMWGIAFMGAPFAQVVLSLGLKKILLTMSWRLAMKILAFLVFFLLLIATIVSKKNPEDYNLTPFGLDPNKINSSDDYNWSLKEAYSNFAIWGAIFAFLSSMVGEFLIWTQVVMYWTKDVKLSLSTATNLYIIIGIAGIFTMPIMGRLSDKLVSKSSIESIGRKKVLIFAPFMGIIACFLLLQTNKSLLVGGISCILFSIYWALEPGGVAAYVASLYGRRSLGKIWGSATLIVMGIGPALGSYMGAYLYDISGNYSHSILFATGAFTLSFIVALFLPSSINYKTPK